MDLKEAEILGDGVFTHWYYRAKVAALLRDLGRDLPREILDIGAGSGFFSRRLLEAGVNCSTCVDIGYLADRDEVWDNKTLRFRRSIDRSDAELVLALDVIEHVPDEVGMMRTYIEKVRRGTKFIISVPAFQWMWSSHDVFLGHYRRYTLESLEWTIKSCGLAVDWSHYYFAGVFPLAALARLPERLNGGLSKAPKSQLRVHSKLENETLAAICALELPVMRRNKLFGLTVFAGCHKE